ncbi:MAG: hypothetical protein SXA11_01355 [Cyanobacteriota bacterium]|nr:hypothetical protein [Cyanobacteriota bacterium]
MQGKQIKILLKSLNDQASSVYPDLARRLDEINRWVKDVKPGLLTAKPLVMAFLLQMIRDSQVLLYIKAQSSTEEQQLQFERMTPTERYWYGYLFPKWLAERDSKFGTWKKKLMAGEFSASDEEIIRLIGSEVIRREGNVWQCFIADLSMATDLIVSGSQQQPLCVQVTSLSEEFVTEKYLSWKETLQNWEIDRGLFISYNPGEAGFVDRLVNLALYNSDRLSVGSYVKFP